MALGAEPDARPTEPCSSQDRLRDCRTSWRSRPGELSSHGALQLQETREHRLAAEEGRGTGEAGGVCKSEVVSRPLSTLCGDGAPGNPILHVPPILQALPPVETHGTCPTPDLKSFESLLPHATGAKPLHVRPLWCKEANPLTVRLLCCCPPPLHVRPATGMGRHTRAPSTCGEVDIVTAPVGWTLSAGTDNDRQCFFLGGASIVPGPVSQTVRFCRVLGRRCGLELLAVLPCGG